MLYSMPLSFNDTCKHWYTIRYAGVVCVINSYHNAPSIAPPNPHVFKRVQGVCDGIDNTFFSAQNSIANDTKGNPMDPYMTGFNLAAGLQASFFMPDVTPPRLLSWDYDTAVGGLTLRFNEPIDPDFFNYSSIAIVSSGSPWSSNSVYVDFQNVAADLLNKQTALSEDLVIQMSTAKFNEVVASTSILVSPNTSYLVLYPKSVTDSSGNWYEGWDAPASAPLQVSRYLPDTIRPLVMTVVLNMTLRTLTLTFTKIMLLSSFNPAELTLQSQSSPANAQVLPLTAALITMQSTSASKVVVLSLSGTLFDTIKRMSRLGRSRATTYIYFTDKLLSDMTPSRNKVIDVLASSAMMITTYEPDYAPPSLLSWYADVGAQTLSLEFSEPVDMVKQEFILQTMVSAIDPTAITLWDDGVVTAASTSYTLSGRTTVANLVGNTVILKLYQDDADNIKKKPPLCVTRERCFATIKANLAQDVATYDSTVRTINNALLPVTLMQSSTSFVQDTVPPLLVSYKLFMEYIGYGVLMMKFDEPVQAQNLVQAGISLRSSTLPDATVVRLSESSFSSDTNSITVDIFMSNYDFVRIKAAKIGTSLTSVFLVLDPVVIKDIAGNNCGGTTTSQILAPSEWYVDDLPPSISALYLDPTKTNLTIYFTDIVYSAKVDLAHLVLFSITSGNKMALTSVRILQKLSNSSALTLDLSPMVSNINYYGLLQTQDDTNMFIDLAGSVVDVPALNPIVKMSISQGIRVGQAFTGFKLDLARGRFFIFTAYPYDTRSVFDPTQVTLIGVQGGVSIPFISRDIASNYTIDMILITASKETLTRFQQGITFTDRSSVLMSFADKAFVDSHGNRLQASLKIPCVQLLADSVPPTLLRFTLDLGSGTMTLAFTKPVEVNLVNLGFIALANTTDTSNVGLIPLSRGIVTTSALNPASTITISLNGGTYPTIRDLINSGTSGIGDTIYSTVVVIAKGFVGDTSIPPNYLVAVSRQADSLSNDAVKPTLQSWDIDFNQRLLRVTFGEAVLPSTNNPTAYRLLMNPAVVSKNEMQLSDSSWTDTTMQGNTVVMHLSLTDCNAIYRMTPALCTGTSNCFLMIGGNAVTDIKGNGIAAVAHVFATLPPAQFIPDRTPAMLTNYSISMQDAVAEFYFDKVVDCSSADMSKLLWQFAAFLGFCNTCEYYKIMNSAPSCGTNRYDNHFHLDIQLADFIPMKAMNRLFKSRAFTFVRPVEGFVLDTFGNPTLEVQDGEGIPPIRPGGYIGDTVRPLLLAFTISSGKVLFLHFNEPVKPSSIDITKVLFLDASYPSTFQQYYLSASLLTGFDSDKTKLQVTFGADFTLIASNSRIFNKQVHTLLSISEGFITDSSGNPVVPVNSSAPLLYGPSVIAWDINMNTGLLSLYFPEAMDVFTPAGLGVQSAKGTSGAAVLLYTMTTMTSYNNLTNVGWFVTLSDADLNSIKFYVPDASTLYLTAPFSQARSSYTGSLLSNLGTIEIAPHNALQARILTRDTKAPVVLSFHFNYNTGMLYLLFDEPIQTTSFVPAGLTVVSAKAGSSATLTAASAKNLTSVNFTTIAIKLCSFDLIHIKAAAKMGTLDNLIIGRNVLFDLAGNAFPGNTQETPILATNSTPDSTPPVLQAGVLDLLQVRPLP